MTLSSWVPKMRPIHCLTAPPPLHQFPPNFTGILLSIYTPNQPRNTAFKDTLTHAIQLYPHSVTPDCQKSALLLLLLYFLHPGLALNYHRTVLLTYIFHINGANAWLPYQWFVPLTTRQSTPSQNSTYLHSAGPRPDPEGSNLEAPVGNRCNSYLTLAQITISLKATSI